MSIGPGKFVADYVQGCIKKGVTSPAAIRRSAETEIDSLNERIKEIEQLRLHQVNLRAVVRYMGGSAKTKKAVSTNRDFTMKWNDLEESFKVLCVNIYNKINVKDVMPSQLRDDLDVESFALNSAIKWLEYNGFISRKETDDGRLLIKGKNWDSFEAKPESKIETWKGGEETTVFSNPPSIFVSSNENNPCKDINLGVHENV